MGCIEEGGGRIHCHRKNDRPSCFFTIDDAVAVELVDDDQEVD